MSAVEVGLVVAVALVATLVVGLVRVQRQALRRLDLVERRLARQDRKDWTDREDVPRAADEAAMAPLDPDGDAVDLRGADPDGEPATVPLDAMDRPTVVAFLSTSCGICMGIWERLDDGELDSEVPGLHTVVVTKDADVEDTDRIRSLAADSRVEVILSSEAWVDYEVPGSPYALVVSARPGTVLTEGSIGSWNELVAMAGTAVTPSR